MTKLEEYQAEFEGTEAAEIIKLARVGMATERDCDALFRYLVLGELLDASEAEEVYLAVQEQVQSATPAEVREVATLYVYLADGTLWDYQTFDIINGTNPNEVVTQTATKRFDMGRVYITCLGREFDLGITGTVIFPGGQFVLAKNTVKLTKET